MTLETWRGIYPITSFVLEALRRKRDEPVATGLSESEQILLNAAEFWAAAAHGTLDQYLLHDPVRRLAAAQQAFAALGAVRVTSLVRVAGEALSAREPGRDTPAQIIAQLDERLAQTEDNVDALIAQYAGGLAEFAMRTAGA